VVALRGTTAGGPLTEEALPQRCTPRGSGAV
jgi:hypothetical protein